MTELPNNIEAEQQLLGALLLNNELHERVCEIISEASFYDPVHSDIYAAICKLIETGRVASPVTLRDLMAGHEGLSVLGGSSYLVRLAGASISSSAVRDYAQIVSDLEKRRKLVEISDDIRHSAMSDADANPSDLIETAEGALFKLAEGRNESRGPLTLLASISTAVERVNEVRMRGGGLAGISTGIRDLDSKISGLSKSDLLILAGRPASGKSSLAVNIATNIARAYNRDAGTGGVVAIFSLEMSHDQITSRILSDVASVSSRSMRDGTLSDDEMQRFVDAARKMQDVPIIIDDTPAITIAQLAARARRIKRSRGLDVLIVDYLQLMRGTSASRGNRVQEISEISMGLKAIAKELNIPVIALSQLSRQVEQREDKRPQLSDLRESGSIEQDADSVMFVYREEYYLEREKPDETAANYMDWAEKFQRAQGKAEIIVGKNRHGSVGTAEVSFIGEFTRFGDLY